MCSCHIEFIFHFVKRNDRREVGGKSLIHIVVYINALRSSVCGNYKKKEDYCNYTAMLKGEFIKLAEMRNQALMPCLFDFIVKQKYKCRKECNNRDNTEQYALCHYKTYVKTELEAHKTKCEEAEYRSQ